MTCNSLARIKGAQLLTLIALKIGLYIFHFFKLGKEEQSLKDG